jgi:Tfp pilus assembly protein PilZ
MFNPSPESERRQAPRVPLTVKVQLFFRGSEIQAYSTDISTTGIFVETPNPLPVGSVVLLGFTLAAGTRKTIQAEGRVVQVRTAEAATAQGVLPGMGIMFQGFLFGKADLAGELSNRLETLRRSRGRGKRDASRDPRFLVGFPVLWGTKPPPTQVGFITEIEPGGAYVITENPQVPGAHLYLSFEVPTSGMPQKVRAVAHVTRANFPTHPEADDEPIGMGITLDEASLEDPSVLEVMERHLQRQRETLLQETSPQGNLATDLPDLSAFLDDDDGVEALNSTPKAEPAPAVQLPNASVSETPPRTDSAPELDLGPLALSPPADLEPEPAAAPVAAEPQEDLDLSDMSWEEEPEPPRPPPAPASSVAWVNPAAAGGADGAGDFSLGASSAADAAELASLLVVLPETSPPVPAMPVAPRPARPAPQRASSTPPRWDSRTRLVVAISGAGLLLLLAVYLIRVLAA